MLAANPARQGLDVKAVPISELAVPVLVVTSVVTDELHRRDLLLTGGKNLELDRDEFPLLNHWMGGQNSLKAVKPRLLEVGIVMLKHDPQAGVINNEMSPETCSLVTGELNRVVTVDEVGDFQGKRRIGMGTLFLLGADFRNSVRGPAVNGYSLVGCSRMSAPELQIKLGGEQSAEIFLDQDLHHAVASQLAAVREGGV